MGVTTVKGCLDDSEELLQKASKNLTCSRTIYFWLEITQGNAILQTSVSQCVMFLTVRFTRFWSLIVYALSLQSRPF